MFIQSTAVAGWQASQLLADKLLHTYCEQDLY